MTIKVLLVIFFTVGHTGYTKSTPFNSQTGLPYQTVEECQADIPAQNAQIVKDFGSKTRITSDQCNPVQ